MALRPKKSSLFVHTCLFFIGLGFVIFSAVSLWDWFYHTNGTAKPPDSRKIITYSTDIPEEKTVNNTPYSVPADQPKKIIIPSIHTGGYIQQVGLDQYNAVGVPTNIHFAGWFVKSAKPGDKGLSIVDGHVSSRYGTALFSKLGQLTMGDAVHVQFGDNSIRLFQVVERRELSEKKSEEFLFAKKDNLESQLNIITCGGFFNASQDRYNNRVIVVTKRIK